MHTHSITNVSRMRRTHMQTHTRRVDAGMCRVLNNFAEVAVRVLERHVGLAHRLRAARAALPPQLDRLLTAAAQGMDPEAASLPGAAEGYWQSPALLAAAAAAGIGKEGGGEKGGSNEVATVQQLLTVGGSAAQVQRALQSLLGANASSCSSVGSVAGGGDGGKQSQGARGWGCCTTCVVHVSVSVRESRRGVHASLSAQLLCVVTGFPVAYRRS